MCPTPNVGTVDRILRIVAGLSLMVLGWIIMANTLGVILGIVGLILLLTGAVGRCGLYMLFGVSTRPRS